MRDGPAGAFAGVLMNYARSPHPVLLPLGEGTPELPAAAATAFPLPGGEGQGEGRFPQFIARPGILRPAIAFPARKPRRWDLA